MADKSFVFDPRKMIMGPFGRCPRCAAVELGTVSVSNNFHSRRCRNCGHREGSRLPALSKRMIYLDQMALSAIARELDPVWREKTGRTDPFWIEVFDQLERLVKLQLVVCPESPIHEEESAFDDRFEGVLKRLYEHLATGVSLEFPHQILRRQLWEAFQAAKEGRDPDWRHISRERVVSGRLDEWSDRLLISVNMGHLPGAVDDRRQSRDEGYAKLEELWALWAAEAVPFEERLRRERRGLADAAIQSYLKHLTRMGRAYAGEIMTDPMALLPGWTVQIVMSFMTALKEAGVPQLERLSRVDAFLHSEAAMDAPQNQLAALLYAGLARRAANGQKRVPSRGTPNDIDFISAYLPYCDAMFIDNEFAQLLSEEPIAAAVDPYGTRIFSARNRAEFLEYLKDLESDADPDHVQLVHDTYGPSWLEPFRTMLEHERDKAARRASEAVDGQ